MDSTTVDQSEIRKVVTDILRESGTMTQTIVEYYPPTTFGRRESQPIAESEPVSSHTSEPMSPALPGTPAVVPEQPPVQAVKRIIKTEISTESERTTTTDSTANNNIRSDLHSELSDKVAEKSPSSVMAIKWVAIGFVALLLILIILKFSKIKILGIKL
ncbi:hypothetical protein KML24007_03990 [Alistipes indistinctus]